MAQRALAHPKIRFEWNSRVVGIQGDQKVSSVTLADVASGQTRDLPVSGLFIAIGHDPRSELVRDQLTLTEGGNVVVAPETTQAMGPDGPIPGVFAAGDLVDHTYRQAITAAGSGCAAALDAQRFLSERMHELVATA
jgi:thioredoxin reductase (NADPH)